MGLSKIFYASLYLNLDQLPPIKKRIHLVLLLQVGTLYFVQIKKNVF